MKKSQNEKIEYTLNIEESSRLIKKEKRSYIQPVISTEKLNSYGAICNGTTLGGRKASSKAPVFCNATKLNS